MSKAVLSPAKIWWLYVIETDSGSLYTGITTDLQRRFRQHRGELKGGAKYFHVTGARAILFKKRFKNRSEASKYEAYFKALTRAQKLALLAKRVKRP